MHRRGRRINRYLGPGDLAGQQRRFRSFRSLFLPLASKYVPKQAGRPGRRGDGGVRGKYGDPVSQIRWWRSAIPPRLTLASRLGRRAAITSGVPLTLPYRPSFLARWGYRCAESRRSAAPQREPRWRQQIIYRTCAPDLLRELAPAVPRESSIITGGLRGCGRAWRAHQARAGTRWRDELDFFGTLGVNTFSGTTLATELSGCRRAFCP